jgi:hypothetical protein
MPPQCTVAAVRDQVLGGLEQTQAVMALSYALAPMQRDAREQVTAARGKVAELLKLQPKLTASVATCQVCGHEDPCGAGTGPVAGAAPPSRAGQAARSACGCNWHSGAVRAHGIRCCRCSKKLEWCLVSHDRLQALDKEFEALLRPKDMDGWLSHETVHERARDPEYTFAAGPLTEAMLAAFTPFGMPPSEKKEDWTGFKLGELPFADVFAQHYHRKQQIAAKEFCTAYEAALRRAPSALAYSDLLELLNTVHRDSLPDGVADFVNRAHNGFYPYVKYLGGRSAGSASHWIVDQVIALGRLVQRGTWYTGDDRTMADRGGLELYLGRSGTWTPMHMDNLNTIVLHLAVKVQHVRAAKKARTQRGDALSEEDLVGLLQELEDAAPSKQQLRDARVSGEAFSVWLLPAGDPPQATEGRIGQGRVVAAAPHVRRGATLHGRDHQLELVRLVEQGVLQPRVVRHGCAVLLTQGCPHAVVNVAPSDAMMLKLGIDFGRWSELPTNCAMRGLAPLAADVMESSKTAWSMFCLGQANCKAH